MIKKLLDKIKTKRVYVPVEPMLEHIVLDANQKNLVIINSRHTNLPMGKLHSFLEQAIKRCKKDGYDVEFIII